MSLSDFAQVVISSEGAALTQVGFGTLLCAAFHTHYTDLTREYTSTTQLATDGFATTEPGYVMVQRAFQQKPRPQSVKLGRLAHPATQVVKFGLDSRGALSLTVYGFTMIRGAVTAQISYTSDGTATIAEIVAGLAAAVEASTIGGSVAAISADTNTTCQITEGTPGNQTFYSAFLGNLTFSDTTADPGMASDLNAIENADADWYGLGIDTQSKATIEATAAWCESEGLVIFACNTTDSAVYDNTSTTDVAAQMQALSYARTILYFSLQDTGAYSGVAGFAERSTHDPGQKLAGGTWHAKTLTGVAADGLTPTVKAHLRAKNVVPYITTAGRNHTLDGKCIGGEFMDKIRFLDWFAVRTQERITAAELNNDKIPFDDTGISIMVGEVQAQLLLGETAQGFVTGSTSCTALPLAQTDPADKAARKLTSVSFSAELSGAIHFVGPITGVVTN